MQGGRITQIGKVDRGRCLLAAAGCSINHWRPCPVASSRHVTGRNAVMMSLLHHSQGFQFVTALLKSAQPRPVVLAISAREPQFPPFHREDYQNCGLSEINSVRDDLQTLITRWHSRTDCYFVTHHTLNSVA
jgi:hypothetical protein